MKENPSLLDGDINFRCCIVFSINIIVFTYMYLHVIYDKHCGWYSKVHSVYACACVCVQCTRCLGLLHRDTFRYSQYSGTLTIDQYSSHYVYSVQYIVYNVRCILFIIQYKLIIIKIVDEYMRINQIIYILNIYTVHIYGVHRTLYIVHCTLYTVYTLYIVHSYCIQCTII